MVERICEKLCGAWQAFRVTDGATISRAHTHAEAEKDTLGGERQAGRCSLVRTARFFFSVRTLTHTIVRLLYIHYNLAVISCQRHAFPKRDENVDSAG